MKSYKLLIYLLILIVVSALELNDLLPSFEIIITILGLSLAIITLMGNDRKIINEINVIFLIQFILICLASFQNGERIWFTSYYLMTQFVFMIILLMRYKDENYKRTFYIVGIMTLVYITMIDIQSLQLNIYSAGRLIGFFDNSNILGILNGYGIMLVSGLAIKGLFDKKVYNMVFNVAALFVIGFFGYVLYKTNCRSALIGLFVFFGILFLWYGYKWIRKQSKQYQMIAYITLIGLFIVGVIAAFFIIVKITERRLGVSINIFSLTNEELYYMLDLVSSARLSLWIDGLQIITSSWRGILFGQGFGSVPGIVFENFLFTTDYASNIFHPHFFHNVILDTVLYSGIVGLGLFITGIWMAIVQCIRAIKSKLRDADFIVIVLAIILSLLAIGMFDNVTYFKVDLYDILFWAFLGILINYTRLDNDDEKDNK